MIACCSQLNQLSELYGDMKAEGIIFAFSGPVSQRVVEGIANALRSRLQQDECTTSVSQRVFSVFVEQMQNILRYSHEGAEDMREGLLVLGRGDEGYYVVCANYLNVEAAQRLRHRLDGLRHKDAAQLKELYRRVRREETAEDSLGAGLGFIEIARSASAPLDYHFSPQEGDRCFFALRTSIAECV